MKSILFLTAATSALLAPMTTAAQTAPLITTITNPAPTTNRQFGFSVAAVGSDQVLIGAYYPVAGFENGAAYLYQLDGTLLNTFTNGTYSTAYFGYSVASVGDDLLLVGAPVAAGLKGEAYLVHTNGNFVKTLTNPTPESDDSFGATVAAMDSDHVLIGAPGDNFGGSQAGVVHIFNTDGTLFTTITNPMPTTQGRFGAAVATVGTKAVLVGAPFESTQSFMSGMAFLMSTNGDMIRAFTNPVVPYAGNFGQAVAALGADKLLIAAPFNYRGMVYLYNTNGSLLTTFTNPVPFEGNPLSTAFGLSITPLGNDHVLIGAPWQDIGNTSLAGLAFLFSMDGSLVATLTNPAPVSKMYFGYSLAPVGKTKALVGAPFYSSSDGPGAAYLFDLSSFLAPSLCIRQLGDSLAISWPSPSEGFVLQRNTNGIGSLNWSNVVDSIEDDGTNRTFAINAPQGSQFFRLMNSGSP